MSEKHIAPQRESLDAQFSDSISRFRDNHLNVISPALQRHTEILYPDLQSSYHKVDTPGSTYNPEKDEISFMVEADPSVVQGMDLILFEDDSVFCRHQTVEMKQSEEGKFQVTIKGTDIEPGILYAFKPYGEGINPLKVSYLIDPYAKALVRPEIQWLASKLVDLPDAHELAPGAQHYMPPRSVVIHLDKQENPVPRNNIKPEDQIIYEFHVQDTKTFPDHLIPEEEAHLKGKQGTIEFLECSVIRDFFKKNSINIVELMPVQFADNEWDLESVGSMDAWGYNVASFMAPQPEYFANKNPHEQLYALRRICELYREEGMEVIIDFVAGHTHELAPGNDDSLPQPAPMHDMPNAWKGPTTSLRALSPEGYYHLKHDLTGCGNTFRTNSKEGNQLLTSARKHWIRELRVGGLRIDQAKVFGRVSDHEGMPYFSPKARALTEFKEENSILIAEPNDVKTWATGQFPEDWQEWIFYHRNTAREFFSQQRTGRDLSQLLSGFQDTFHNHNRTIHFTACHDGRTTYDQAALIVEALKNNGPFPREEPEIEVIKKQISLSRTMLSFSILSPGPFMITHGDDSLKTQSGNRNSWDAPEHIGLEWDPHSAINKAGQPDRREQINFRNYVASLIELRKNLEVFNRIENFSPAELSWHCMDGIEINAKAEQLIMEQGWNKDQALKNSWDDRKNFLGALYLPEPEENKAPVYVSAWNGGELDIKLPPVDPESGARWKLCACSSTGRIYTNDPENTPGKELEDLTTAAGVQQHYSIGGPGVAVFVLR